MKKAFSLSKEDHFLHCAESQSANFSQEAFLFEETNHYRDKRHFFEWWYIDVTSKNGYHIVVIFHAPLYTFRFLKPYTSIEVYGPNGEKIDHSECVDKRRKSVKDNYGVSIENNYFKGQYPWYKLFWKNENIELDLLLESRIKSWKLGTGSLFRDNRKKERCFNWVVPVPRATVSGGLKIKDRFFEVDGVGYHDHNWGNFVLRDVFSWWYWGRIFTDKYTLLYADLKKKSGHITPFMMARKGKIVVSTNRAEILQDYWTRKNKGPRFPQQFTMKVTNREEQIELTTKIHKIMEKYEYFFNPFQSPFLQKGLNAFLDGSHFLSHFPVLARTIKYCLGKSVYLRLLVAYDLRINSRERFTGNSIQEIMLLRPDSK